MKRGLVIAGALVLLVAARTGASAQDKVVKFGIPADFTKVYTFVSEDQPERLAELVRDFVREPVAAA